jgi:hypothetical protein
MFFQKEGAALKEVRGRQEGEGTPGDSRERADEGKVAAGC